MTLECDFEVTEVTLSFKDETFAFCF